MMAMLGFFGNSSANYLWNIANKQPITMDAHIFGIISLALLFFIATGALYYINRLIKK